MPKLKLSSMKLPDLREMSAEDIKGDLKQALSDVRVKDMKLSDIDLSKVELPKIDLSKIDLPAAVAAAAEATPLRRKRRSRGRFILAGLIVAALGAFVVMNASSLRARLDDITRRIRERSDAGRVHDSLEDVDDQDQGFEPIAVPVQADPYAASLPSAADPTGTTTEPTSSGEMREHDAAQDGEVRLPGS